jgi:hypothetical protein
MGGDGCSSSSASAGPGKPAGVAQPRAEDARDRSAPATPPKPAEPKPGATAPAPPQPGAQSAAQQPPPAATGDFLRRDTDARWGVLPPKLQERLLNLHVDAIPERYRTWLAAYVRELQRRDGVAAGP